MKVLVLNAGSSSQKSCLYELGAAQLANGLSGEVQTSEPKTSEPPAPLWEAQISTISGRAEAGLVVRTSNNFVTQRKLENFSSEEALIEMLETLWGGTSPVVDGPDRIDIIGHRIVHGGPKYCGTTSVTSEVEAEIARFAPLAPAHNRAALEGIAVTGRLFAAKPQIAVFDTAFHRTLPDAAATYPIPYEWSEQGIRRYGFHGISHQYCVRRAAQLLKRELSELRMVSCHLGNGCSLAAVRGGYSVDTTMGFTPLEGLMMGTRSGSIDPGVLLYLLREKGIDAAKLDQMLEHESGLKGISGLSGDMRDIEWAMERGDNRAKLAFDIYVHHIRTGICSMLPSLGGLDALVFTGGVGENSDAVRAAVCDGLSFLGVAIDPERNGLSARDSDISATNSQVRTLIIRSQEDWAIAEECRKFLANKI